MAAVEVLVNGAQGKMGREVVAAVRAEPDLRLVGETDLGDSLEAAIRARRPQVVVDFTVPACAVENTETILRSGACPVVGTTGFTARDIERLQEVARQVGRGGLIAPNFAIGAVLLMKFAAEAARFFPAVEVIELHHDQKLDAPSGTAVKTVEMLARATGRVSLSESERRGPGGEHESIPGVRGGTLQGVRIHSVRLPGLVAHQEVLLGGPGQVLSLRHDTTSRTSFMPGVLLAVRKAPQLQRLHYGLESILDL